jgi:hypothetical protein
MLELGELPLQTSPINYRCLSTTITTRKIGHTLGSRRYRPITTITMSSFSFSPAFHIYLVATPLPDANGNCEQLSFEGYLALRTLDTPDPPVSVPPPGGAYFPFIRLLFALEKFHHC